MNYRLCQTTETFTHAFVVCVDAVFFWDVVKRAPKKDFDGEEEIFCYLHFSDQLDSVPDTLVDLGFYSLWKTRKVDSEGGVAKPSWVNVKNLAIAVAQRVLKMGEDAKWKEIVQNLSRSPEIIRASFDA